MSEVKKIKSPAFIASNCFDKYTVLLVTNLGPLHMSPVDWAGPGSPYL